MITSKISEINFKNSETLKAKDKTEIELNEQKDLHEAL